MKVAILATVVGVVLVAGVVVAVTFGTASPAHSASALATQVPSTAPAIPTAQPTQRPSPSPTPPAPLQVMSISPASGASGVNGTSAVTVTFSAPLAPTSPLPTFSPAISGTWHAGSGSTMVFTPTTPVEPTTEVTLNVPGGSSGVRSDKGGRLAKSVSASFETADWSTLRLEQVLAQLGYLPLSWAPDGSSPAATDYAGQISAAYAYSAPAGKFTWQAGYPSELTSQWHAGQPGLILAGALRAFQADHGLEMTGEISSALWQDILAALAKGEDNPHGYSFAVGNKASPETLTVWHEGKEVFHGLTNSGISVSPTVDGTFPVYLRYRNQVMKGTNPDGSKYADPVEFVSYFNGGDAVHSYYRPSYGFPQSLGCLELPLASAQKVWPYLTYGTLVTVIG